MRLLLPLLGIMIFFNIEMLKANRPLPPARIISDLDRYDREFFDEIATSDEILFYDVNGIKTSITTKEKSEYSQVDSNGYYSSTRDYYSLRKPYYYSYVTSEGKEYLFDFESNKLMGYHIEALGELLSRDSVLFSEYTSLRKREKKKMMVDFIRRYNKNHPLYFPDN